MDNTEYIEDFATRIVRRAGERVGEVYEGADLGALSGLVLVAEQAVVTAVAGMRRQGVSWQAIADELKVSRQAAHARFSPYCEPNAEPSGDLVRTLASVPSSVPA